MAIIKLNNNSISAVTALPAGVGGKVLQIVNAYTQTSTTSNSATYADTNLTATITPSSASNKVLVLIDQSGAFSGNSYMSIRVYRNATEIGGTVAGRSIGYTGDSSANYIGTAFSCSILDTPSSTSALTYKTQFNADANIGTARVQTDGAASYITLIEIAG